MKIKIRLKPNEGTPVPVIEPVKVDKDSLEYEHVSP
jgi:hypothetical protein